VSRDVDLTVAGSSLKSWWLLRQSRNYPLLRIPCSQYPVFHSVALYWVTSHSYFPKIHFNITLPYVSRRAVVAQSEKWPGYELRFSTGLRRQKLTIRLLLMSRLRIRGALSPLLHSSSLRNAYVSTGITLPVPYARPGLPRGFLPRGIPIKILYTLIISPNRDTRSACLIFMY
jgi:hypothetical protein